MQVYNYSYFCVCTFDVFIVSFLTNLRSVSKIKGKDVLVRSSANLKSFLNGDLHFFIYLKSCCFFFSHTHIHTNFAFGSLVLFSIASALFQDFLSNQTHIAKIPFWFLETQGSTIDSIYGLLLLSRAPQDSIDTKIL